MVAGWWLLVGDWWLVVAGCWLLVAGCWLLVGGWWMMVDGGWWIPVGATYVPARLPVFRSLHNLGQSPCGDLDSPVGACALNTGQRRILTQPVYLFSDAIENPNPTKTPSDRLAKIKAE